MFKNLKIRTKFILIFSSIAIMAVWINGYISYTSAQKALNEESFNKLTAVREMKATQIEDFLQQIYNQVVTLSEDRMIIDAMKAFDDGIHNIGSDFGINEEKLAIVDAENKSYYEKEYLKKLSPNLDDKISISDYWPESPHTRILQNLYISSNPNEPGSKHLLTDAGDGSSYSKAHAIYHPIIKSYLEKFGYYDIFLVDADTGGNIVYTVFKEADYGTSLSDGPYSQTNFAKVYNLARKADNKDFVVLADFEPYHPSYNAPASFIASPIFDGDKKIGVLVFQMPIDKINDIMTSKQEWSKVGLGLSGETYIVGKDYKLRNQSRFLIEDSSNYFKMIKNIGTPENTIDKIRKFNSTIGLQRVETFGTKAALSGKTDTQIFPDYRGVSVLSSYRPLNIPDVNWAIMSEIDEEEAFAHADSLRINIIILFFVLVVVIVIIAIYVAKAFTKPLNKLTDYSLEFSQHDFSGEEAFKFSEGMDFIADRGDEIGSLAASFKRMSEELANSIETLKNTMSAKERMEGELNVATEIQMSMLPLIFPAFPDYSEFSIYAVLKPAREVGGDFYDFFFIDEDWFCFCIGDVSGKGVPSALFMAVTKTLIKSRASNDLSPASILTHVNDELSKDNKTCMFVTIFLCIMNVKNGDLVYTNAGHNPPYLKKADSSLITLDNRHGPIVGAVEGMVYKEDKTRLSKDDTIFLFTDGITEAMDSQNKLFSEKRLEDLLSSSKLGPPQDLVDGVITNVEQYEEGTDQTDDITVLALQYIGTADDVLLHKLEFTIKNELAEISKVNEHFTTFAEQYGIPQAVSLKINIVFDELLSNIISYSFQDEKEHKIEIKVELFGNRLAVMLEDTGSPFNPFGVESPNTGLSIEEREIGGLGIHIVKNIMDDVSYQRRIEKNLVTLVKHLDK